MTIRHDSGRHEAEYERGLLRIAAKHHLPAGAFDDPAVRARALRLLRRAYTVADPELRLRLDKAADFAEGRSPPRALVTLVLKVLGVAGLHAWAERELPGEMDALGTAATLEYWLINPPIRPNHAELRAGLKAGARIASDIDNQIIEARLGQSLRRVTVPTTFMFDPRAHPFGFNLSDFKDTVTAEVRVSVPGTAAASTVDFVLGAMSLDGFLLQTSPDVLQDAARQLAFESGGKSRTLGGDPQVHRQSYEDIATNIDALRAVPGAAAPKAFFEELAFVARRLLANSASVPIDAPGLRDRVAEVLTEYVPGQAGGTLDLPPLDGPDMIGSDLVRDNIRAVALIYAAWCLEDMRLFGVLDRVIEVFMNGQLPVGFDNGGRALSEYYFSADEVKISEAARRMTYTRVLGVPGGEVSPEAPPNAAFGDLFLRFLASVSELDRQRRVADVIGGNGSRDDSLTLTGEQVRKAGRDLAANVTLFGYGGTFFVAQKLKGQVEQALKILSTPQILSSYGVQSPFQVIERVCASDFGGRVPNIVRYKTMAESGKKILDIIAGNIPAWLGLSGRDLFRDPFGPAEQETDIDISVQRELARSTEDWLAVNGIKDDQRARLGEPAITAATPSIPTAMPDAGGAGFDQLKQMVASGQAPSLDQLKALLPDTVRM